MKNINKERLRKLFPDHDPLSGRGCWAVKREKVTLDGEDLWLPLAMLKDEFVEALLLVGDVNEFARAYDSTRSDVLGALMEARFKYDFEFWAATTIKIQDKIILSDIPFVLRPAQMVVLHELEGMRLRGIPIRAIILKARQWGGSTLVQMYFFWLQQIHKINWNLAVVAQVEGAAANVSELYKRAARFYPPEISSVTFKPYARSSKNVVSIERGGIIGVGSANNPDQFRSYNFAMLHLSEVAFFPETPQRTSKQLVTALRSAVPKSAMTAIILESTARGVGSFFHNEWLQAEKGESDYVPVFVPWFSIELYIKEIDDIDEFISNMTARDMRLWDLGATLEGINWYNDYQKGENFSDSMMQNEFPSTPEEAFTASGSMYFSRKSLDNAKAGIINPLGLYKISELKSYDKIGLAESVLEESATGYLKVWGLPKTEVVLKGKKHKIKKRYIASIDIGGTHKDADYSVVTILDRYWTLFNGPVKVAATLRMHLKQDNFVWLAAQLATIYDNALFIPETNSLTKEKTEGDFFLTILDTLKDYYDNIYVRNQIDNLDKDWVPKYGFHTNRSSKEMILQALSTGLEDGGFEELDFDAYEEYGFYERKPDGTLGNVEGKHDDIVMTRAIGYWASVSPVAYDPVRLMEIKESKPKKRIKKGLI